MAAGTETLIDCTLREFAERSAARTPTPGGGAIAAALGVHGTTMGAMAARFTEGRKGFEQHAPVLAAEIKRLDQLRQELLGLVDADAEAYAGVGAAYGLPRGTPEEKAARKTAIQSALVAAMQPPLSICRASVTGLAVLDSLRQHVNPNVSSDVAVGAYALAAAFRAASVNVLINLKGITDEDLRDQVSREGAELAQRAAELETAISTAVVTAIEED